MIFALSPLSAAAAPNGTGPARAALLADVSFSGSSMLLITAIAIACCAMLSIISVIKSRRETQSIARIARARADRMNDLMCTIRMAEKIAGLGIWQYDPTTGEQQWSQGMRRLFGVKHDDTFVEGDVETLLFAHDIDLVGNVARRANQTEPFTLIFDILDYEGQPQTISFEACNLRGSNGAVARVVAVLRNITDEKTRERQLEVSRKVAVDEARRARDLADTDPLTGLANRRRVMATLDRAIVDTRRDDGALVLVVFDVDHFKLVNDTYGHPHGDKVLKKIAEIARQQARQGDLVGRVGGEEFVWLIPGAGNDYASMMTERLREAISRNSAIGEMSGVTISVGYAVLREDDTSLTLFARADDALYEAKSAGRNTVRMAA